MLFRYYFFHSAADAAAFACHFLSFFAATPYGVTMLFFFCCRAAAAFEADIGYRHAHARFKQPRRHIACHVYHALHTVIHAFAAAMPLIFMPYADFAADS